MRYKLVMAALVIIVTAAATIPFWLNSERTDRDASPSNAPVAVLPADPVQAQMGTADQPLFTYTGDGLPLELDGWNKGYAAYEAIAARTAQGVLHITDGSTAPETALIYSREWQQVPGTTNVAEFVLKVVSTGGDPTTYYPYFPAGYVGTFIGTSDGDHNMVYTLYTDRILSSFAETLTDGRKEYRIGGACRFDTTSQFNRYRTVIEKGVATLYINDVLVLRQAAGKGMYDMNGIEFGAGSSQGTGEVLIDEVRAYQVRSTGE